MSGELFGLPTPMVVLAAGVMLAVLLAGYAVSAVGGGDERRARRVRAVSRRGRGDSATPTRASASQASLRRSTTDSGIRILDAAIKKYVPKPEMMRKRLMRTGLALSLGNYVLANGVVLLGVFGLLWEYVGLSPVLAGMLAVPAGLGVPHFVVGFLIRRRQQKFLSMFPEALDLVVRGLKSGLPVTESMRVVAKEIEDPVGGEFQQIIDYIHLGNTMEESLWLASERIGVPEFRFFVVSISVQRETGGNLGETLENLADILRKRRQAKLKVKALSSEARASAMIIGALPFLMFALIRGINPEYTQTLLSDPRGLSMLVAGGIWMGIGAAVMWKMVRFEI